MSGSPRTIEEAVALLNALPKPTSVPCFVESLDRPLAAYATNSIFSAQPADSSRSPRVFLKVGRTWLSVVVDGPSSYLVEFGELIGDGFRSLKGEIELPVEDVVAPTAPYERVLYDADRTSCGFCHRGEQRESLAGSMAIFSSLAFRPRPETRVAMEALRQEAEACDWLEEPHRCDMLSALFAGGSVVEESFPPEMETFF